MELKPYNGPEIATIVVKVVSAGYFAGNIAKVFVNNIPVYYFGEWD